MEKQLESSLHVEAAARRRIADTDLEKSILHENLADTDLKAKKLESDKIAVVEVKRRTHVLF